MLAQNGDGLRHVGVGQVVSAGAQGSRWSLLKSGEHFVGEAAEVNKVALEEALDSVAHAVYAAHALGTRLADYANQGRIDGGGRTAGLADYQGRGGRRGGCGLVNRRCSEGGAVARTPVGASGRAVPCIIAGSRHFDFRGLPRFGTDIHALLLRK